MNELPNKEPAGFWKKLQQHAVEAGFDTVEAALKLYYALRDPDTPAWAKTVIYGALVYFISPIDALPDFLPGGYVDDLGTLLSAIATISSHIKNSHKMKAQEKLGRWFKRESNTANQVETDNKENQKSIDEQA